jgi:hypothetical protein
VGKFLLQISAGIDGGIREQLKIDEREILPLA